MAIHIENLSYDATEEDLKDLFGKYGTMTYLQLPTDRETQRTRGYAFVEMSSEAEETKAIEALNGTEWMDRLLKVTKCKPREDRSRPFQSLGDNRKSVRRY